MALRKIVTVGDPILTKVCRPVTKFDQKLAILIEDMIETMHDANGVGLAGPQVGILRRVVVVDAGDEDIELVNPEVVEVSEETQTGLEERGLIQASVRLRDALAANLQREPYCREPAQLLGPAPAPVARVNYSYRYQLTLMCRNTATIRRLLAFVLAEFSKDRQNRGLTALIDINSYN